MMKAQESQKKLAGHDRGRQEKQKKPWRCQTQISQKKTQKISGFQCTLLGSVQIIKGNKVVSVKGKSRKWLTTAL